MTGQQSQTTTYQLARRLSPLHVWALSLGCIIGWGSFIMPGTTFLPSAGPLGTALAMAIAAVAMIIIAFNYSFMIERYPRAGGEYAYVEGTFGKTHAFICSWLLGLCYLALVAQNATALALVGRNLLGSFFQVGFHYSVAGYEIYFGELALAIGALILFALLSIRGVQLSGILQTILVLCIVGGVCVVALFAFLGFGGATMAPTPAFNPSVNPVSGMLRVLAIAPFAFVGFDTIPQAAEEYHFSPSKARMLIVVSIVFGALIYVTLTVLAASVVPSSSGSWPAYIASVSSLEGIESLPTFHAAYAILGQGGVWALGIAVLGAILSGIIGFYLATSRLLFAMGREGLLPQWFAAVHPRYKTPKNALLFILFVSIVAPFFGRTVLGWLVDMSSLGAAVAYGYTSLAALKTARAQHNRVITITGIVGTVLSVLFIVLLLVPLPSVASSLGPQAYSALILWVVLGFVFYRMTRLRKGI